ncbi:MAG: putative peptide zinc metalloprotease protein [Actinomycetota bacterium]|jgi:putative peptide zinc metalloprotease protein|nr:putative peptide zinc metalloprotease protein [Actinomycetota bacterium]
MMVRHNYLAPRLVAFVIAFGLLFGTQSAFAQESPAPEETAVEQGGNANGGDNLALAVNTKDNSSVVKFAFEVRRVMNGVVDETNAAVAVASCENCRTIAVAIQIVLIVNDPSVVSPTNIALAENVECTSCETFASAYQYVFTTGGQLKFSKEGWDALKDLRKQISELLKDDSLDLATLATELEVLTDQLSEVIRNELRPAEEVEAEPEVAASSTPEPESSPDDTGSTPTPEPEPTQDEPSPTPSD